eukprot:5733057-Amphidinium_carterae.1
MLSSLYPTAVCWSLTPGRAAGEGVDSSSQEIASPLLPNANRLAKPPTDRPPRTPPPQTPKIRKK